MNKELNELLNNVETVIDKKCLEIKKEKRKKRTIIFMILGYILIPSVLYLLNVSFLYFIIGVFVFISLKMFCKLPDILKKNLEVKCYE